MNQPLVLVVDENAPLRLNLIAFLEESSFAVAQAATAEDALVLVNREHPEIVILDMILPRSGGRALARQIKSLYPDLPIIAISASPSALPSLADGDFAAALAKPFDREELVDLVRGLWPGQLPTTPKPLGEPDWLPSEEPIGRYGTLPRDSGQSRPMAHGSAVR